MKDLLRPRQQTTGQQPQGKKARIDDAVYKQRTSEWRPGSPDQAPDRSRLIRDDGSNRNEGTGHDARKRNPH